MSTTGDEDIAKLKHDLGYTDEAPQCKSCRSFQAVGDDEGMCSTSQPWMPLFAVSSSGYCRHYFQRAAFEDMKAMVEARERKKDEPNEHD